MGRTDVKRRAFLKTAAGVLVPSIMGRAAIPMGLSDTAFLGRRRPAGSITTPDSIPGLIAWWKADSLSLADGTAIGGAGNEWIDQAGAFDGTQSNAAFRPTFETNIYGSMPAIRFDGTNDALVIPKMSFAASTEFTFILVGTVNAAISCWFSDFITGNFQLYRGNNFMGAYATPTALHAVSSGFSSALGTLSAATARRQVSGNIRYWENATNLNLSFVALPDVIDYTRISHSTFNFFSGDMAEICVFDNYITDGDLTSLYNEYLKPRWGLP